MAHPPKYDDIRLAIIDLIDKNGGVIHSDDGLLTPELALALEVDNKIIGDQLFKLRKRGILELDREGRHTYSATLAAGWEEKLGPELDGRPQVKEVLVSKEEEVYEDDEPSGDIDYERLAQSMIREAAAAMAKVAEADQVLAKAADVMEQNERLTVKIEDLQRRLNTANADLAAATEELELTQKEVQEAKAKPKPNLTLSEKERSSLVQLAKGIASRPT